MISAIFLKFQIIIKFVSDIALLISYGSVINNDVHTQQLYGNDYVFTNNKFVDYINSFQGFIIHLRRKSHGLFLSKYEAESLPKSLRFEEGL